MSAPAADPAWLKLLVALVQAGVGAASALIAVFLTQRSTQKERRLKTFEKINEPFINAHTEIFSSLVDLQEVLASGPALTSQRLADARRVFLEKVKHRLVWLDETVGDKCVAIAELMATADGDHLDGIDNIRQDIVACQKAIRSVIGVPQFKAVLEEMRKA